MRKVQFTVTGNGGAGATGLLHIPMGFTPDRVNITMKETPFDSLEILLTDGVIDVALHTNADDGVRTEDAYVSLYAGTTAIPKGITLGGTAGVNVTGEVLLIEAELYH